MGMYRRPVMRNPRRGRVSSQISIPAPVGGWNKRDVISGMPETDAYDIENFFPKTSEVILRRGYTGWVTTITGNVESLMEYASPTVRALFAGAGTDIFDVSVQDTLGAAVVSGRTNVRFQHTMFTTAAGSFLIICNGADDVTRYDGTTWTTVSGITGVVGADLIHVNSFKNRLYFTEKNTLSVWYLGLNAITGAATEFDLGPLAKMGGYLVAMFNWSVDAGDGQDDLAVFLTSQGEVIVYSGLNPGDASWRLEGVYNIGRPIGRRCAMKYGGDLMVITEDGYVFLSKVLPSSRGSDNYAASDKIQGAVLDATRSYKTEFGWQPVLYPQGQYGLVNVPQGNGSFVQHVFNTETASWTRFRGMDAYCWSLFNDELYFGAAGMVCKADNGVDDMGNPVRAYVKPAFSYFRSPGRNKRFTAIRPIFSAPFLVRPVIQFNVDFEDAPIGAYSNPSELGALWDVALWDVATWPDFFMGLSVWGDAVWGEDVWPAETFIRKGWQSLSNIGMAGSAAVAVESTSGQISLYSFDYIFEAGGPY